MKATWTLGTALLSVVVAAAGIQAQGTKSDNDQKESITLTGCLQGGSERAAAVGTSGSGSARTNDSARSGSADSGSGTLILANARVGGAPGGVSAVTSVAPPGSGTTESAARAGTTAPTPALTGAIDKNGNIDKAAPQTYLLRSTENPELPCHIGQEVEFSGRLITGSAATGSSSSSATGSSSSGASGASAGASGNGSGSGASANGASLPTLDVKTVRMVSSVCVTR